MRKNRVVILLLNCLIVILLLLLKSHSVYAVTVTINSVPSTISTDPFTLNITVSGAQTGTNYLRVDLFAEGTTSYFGETYNGASWYNDIDFSQYFPITIVSGTDWVGDIQGKIGSNPPDNGPYKLKIRRYTSQSSYIFSNSVDLNIDIPSPTPTITPTPTTTPITTPTQTPTPTIELTPTPVPISYDNIYLSEVMTYPDTKQNEWVEIYNDNDFSAVLNNWYIDDAEDSGSTPKIFYLDIPAKNYAVYNLKSSIFNNSGDTVRLLDFNKNLKDSFEYESSSKGKTLGRTSYENDDFCLQESSKAVANNSCLNPTATPQPDPTNTPKPANTTDEKTPKSTNAPRPSKITIKEIPQETGISYQTAGNEEELGEDNPEKLLVLGESTENINYSSIPLTRSFSFASFSFSLLTMISILFKISHLN